MNIIFDYSKNNSDKNYAAYQALDSIKREFFNVRYSKRNSLFLKQVIQKILSSKYINEENKSKIREDFDNIKYYNQTERDEYLKNQTDNSINVVNKI